MPVAARPSTQAEHHRNADEKTIVVPHIVEETIECVRSGPKVPARACRPRRVG